MGTRTTQLAKKKPYTAEPAYRIIAEPVPNHTSRTPRMPQAQAAKKLSLEFLSAHTPKASLQIA